MKFASLYFFLLPLLVVALSSSYSLNSVVSSEYSEYLQTKRITTPYEVQSLISRYGSFPAPYQFQTLASFPASKVLGYVSDLYPTSILTGFNSPYYQYERAIYGKTVNAADGRLGYPIAFVAVLSLVLPFLVFY